MREHIPWRGSRYEIGINQEPLAILGYSHWFSENEEDSDELTIRVMSKVITGEYSDIPFFNQIRDYFGFESNKEFWNRVLFFNYLPDAIGIADERFKTGNVGQIERAKERYERIIEEHRLHKMLVFTKKGWATLPPTREEQAGSHALPLGGEFPGFSWGTYDSGADHHIVMAFGLRHPQGARGELMRGAVKRILAMPRVG